jgi:hypothetical protein
MSSSQDQKATTDSSGGKQATPSDKTVPENTDSHTARRASGSGHEITGAEKFASGGGSGGVPMRTGQGYEAYH